MQASKLREALTSVGLSQGKFAALCSVNIRTVRRWVATDRRTPLSWFARLIIDDALKKARHASQNRTSPPEQGQ